MPVKLVSELDSRSLPVSVNDFMIVADPTTGEAYKCTVSNIVVSASLAGLSDVNINTPLNGHLFQYFTSDNKWHNIAILTGGTF